MIPFSKARALSFQCLDRESASSTISACVIDETSSAIVQLSGWSSSRALKHALGSPRFVWYRVPFRHVLSVTATRRTTDSAPARASSSFHSGTLRILEQRCPDQKRPTRRPIFRPTRTGGELVSCLISLLNLSVLRSPSAPSTLFGRAIPIKHLETDTLALAQELRTQELRTQVLSSRTRP